MKNKEKFAEKIIDIALHGGLIAIQNGAPVDCVTIDCTKCDMYKSENCCDSLNEWLEAEYVPLEEEVDWSKVPVDTPILVRDAECERWYKRHFAMYENERVYAWGYGSTSWSLEWNANRAIPWNYAKLASPEEMGEGYGA